ncbi:MAG: hypothetical protein Q9200_006624, partial [Gallowayella weberi]
MRSTPSAPPPSLKKSSSSQSSKNQKSITGFFQKKSSNNDTTPLDGLPTINRSKLSALTKTATQGPRSSLTPAPSSDAIEEPQSDQQLPSRLNGIGAANGLPSPITPASGVETGSVNGLSQFNSPSRKAKRVVSYAESEDDDEEDDVFNPSISSKTRGRALKKRKTSPSPGSDDFIGDDKSDFDGLDPDDFVVADDSDEEAVPSKKRKRPSGTATKQLKSSPIPPPDDEENTRIPAVSTAQQWSYDPDNVQPLQPRPANIVTKKPDSSGKKGKEKAHTTDPDKRHPWLAHITDMDRNPPGHPDYDPRTLYIPPLAWTNFSAFEKQYWEIKQKFWDTIVFFKKGKFYELYENDATIGHQL